MSASSKQENGKSSSSQGQSLSPLPASRSVRRTTTHWAAQPSGGKDFYIIFAGIIEHGFATRLVAAIGKAQASAGRIVIFFSSLGGNIQEGFTIASVIQNSRIPVCIHATNNIDSIANVIYLSAKERTAESYAKFYLHGANTTGTYDERELREQLLSIKTENLRIAQFVAENSKLHFNRVQAMMRAGSTLTAQQALEYGIVEEITHKEIPIGVPKEEIVAVN
jgi:ATP-dependent Clp protease protease subunit